jgi:hypothetical protein
MALKPRRCSGLGARVRFSSSDWLRGDDRARFWSATNRSQRSLSSPFNQPGQSLVVTKRCHGREPTSQLLNAECR